MEILISLAAYLAFLWEKIKLGVQGLLRGGLSLLNQLDAFVSNRATPNTHTPLH